MSIFIEKQINFFRKTSHSSSKITKKKNKSEEEESSSSSSLSSSSSSSSEEKKSKKRKRSGKTEKKKNLKKKEKKKSKELEEEVKSSALFSKKRKEKKKKQSIKKKSKKTEKDDDELVTFHNVSGKYIIVKSIAGYLVLAGGPDECKTPTVMGTFFFLVKLHCTVFTKEKDSIDQKISGNLFKYYGIIRDVKMYGTSIGLTLSKRTASQDYPVYKLTHSQRFSGGVCHGKTVAETFGV